MERMRRARILDLRLRTDPGSRVLSALWLAGPVRRRGTGSSSPTCRLQAGVAALPSIATGLVVWLAVRGPDDRPTALATTSATTARGVSSASTSQTVPTSASTTSTTSMTSSTTTNEPTPAPLRPDADPEPKIRTFKSFDFTVDCPAVGDEGSWDLGDLGQWDNGRLWVVQPIEIVRPNIQSQQRQSYSVLLGIDDTGKVSWLRQLDPPPGITGAGIQIDRDATTGELLVVQTWSDDDGVGHLRLGSLDASTGLVAKGRSPGVDWDLDDRVFIGGTIVHRTRSEEATGTAYGMAVPARSQLDAPGRNRAVGSGPPVPGPDGSARHPGPDDRLWVADQQGALLLLCRWIRSDDHGTFPDRPRPMRRQWCVEAGVHRDHGR